jgi:hypothetical protein
MSCKTCSELQHDIELAAREFSRAVQESQTAILPISGVVAGNRIEEAERTLRVASGILEMHKQHCPDFQEPAPKAEGRWHL